MRELIIAVHRDFLSGKSRLLCRIEFTARYDIDADPFLARNGVDRFAGKCLGGIEYESVSVILRIDGILINPHHASDIALIEDIERRTELLGQIHTVGTADCKMSFFIDKQRISCVYHRNIIPHFVASGQ